MGNLLVIHGGAPTSVINSSLYGVIDQARKLNYNGKILAADSGTGGLLNRKIIDLTNISSSTLEALKSTPGSAIGTGRDHLEDEDYFKIATILEDYNIDHVIFNGGNGTMDTALKLSKVLSTSKINVVGIPKTMDNDLSLTDHSPGYGSASRYVASSLRELSMDIKSLPIHVSVFETFGRNAGWLTASASLAHDENNKEPRIMLFPEVPFDEDKFLTRVEEEFKKGDGLVVVASEGLKDKSGKPIVKPIMEVDRSVYFGDVSSHLATLIISKLKIKARSEKPGILSRSSSYFISSVDREEAIECGRTSLNGALNGLNGEMSIIKRVNSSPYKAEIEMHKIDSEILKEKLLSKEYISEDGFGVTDEFIKYATPLVGEEKIPFISFRG